MASTDNFKPGAGGLQVSVVGAQQQQRELGKNFMLGSAPPPPALTQGALPSHQQAQIGQGNTPKGAQPVSLMGMPVQGLPILGQQAVGQQAALGQAQTPRLPIAPQSAPQQPQRALGGPDGEVHTIVVELQGGDGKKYFAEYDVVAPRGSKVMGVTERFSG
jgi:hypothetical protein